MNKLLIITGPTATGKTKLAIDIAKKYDGELISVDSRQVYKYMDVVTGKDIPEFSIFNFSRPLRDCALAGQFSKNKLNYGYYEIEGVKIWGLDIVEPDYEFNVSDFVDYATVVIDDIWSRGKLPILVGGTAQYIRSLLEPPDTLHIPPNPTLRGELLNYTVAQLQHKLMDLNIEKWEKMNNSDKNNPRRLVRAIEVSLEMQKAKCKRQNYFENTSILDIGLTATREEINRRIDLRVGQRLKAGALKELKKLEDMGYNFDLPSMSGLGYRDLPDAERWKTSERQYAKRQVTYIKKYFPEAKWFDITKVDFKEKVYLLLHDFVPL